MLQVNRARGRLKLQRPVRARTPEGSGIRIGNVASGNLVSYTAGIQRCEGVEHVSIILDQNGLYHRCLAPELDVFDSEDGQIIMDRPKEVELYRYGVRLTVAC